MRLNAYHKLRSITASGLSKCLALQIVHISAQAMESVDEMRANAQAQRYAHQATSSVQTTLASQVMLPIATVLLYRLVRKSYPTPISRYKLAIYAAPMARHV